MRLGVQLIHVVCGWLLVASFGVALPAFSQSESDDSELKDAIVMRVRLEHQLLVYSRKQLAHVRIQPIVDDKPGAKIDTKSVPVAGDVYKFGYIAPKDVSFEIGQEFLIEGYIVASKRKITGRLRLISENESQEIQLRYAEGDRLDMIDTRLLSASLAGGQNSRYYVDFFSRRALTNVYVSIMTKPYTALSAPSARNEIFDVYRLDKVFDADKDAGVTIYAKVADGSAFTDHFVKNKIGNEVSLVFLKREIKTKEQLDRELAERLEEQRRADPFGFIALINEYRAQMGLGALVHDPALSEAARQNNYAYFSSGNPHGVVVGLSGWAMASDPVTAINMWKASGAHNVLMINPSSTRCGFDITGGSATFQIQ